MALGSIAGSIAGSVASAGIGKLMGGGKAEDQAVSALQGAPLRSLRSTGMRFNNSAGAMRLNRTAGVRGGLRQFARTQRGGINQLGNLRRQVKPGFGRLTESRVAAIDNARRKAMGDLSENFARRRISGSSFAADAATRQELEFAQAEEEARAESFLQELDLSTQLMEKQVERRQSIALSKINQANFESNIAVQLAASIQGAMASASQAMAELRLGQAQGIGKFSEGIGSAIGKGVSGLFGGGSSASSGFKINNSSGFGTGSFFNPL